MTTLHGNYAFVSLQNVLPWGGSEELWSGAARQLLERGHRVQAMVYNWPQPAPRVRELAAHGCRLHTVGARPSFGQRLLRRIGIRSRDPFAWLEKDRPDLAVLSLVGHSGGISEAQACRNRSIPYVLVIQSASETLWPAAPDLERLDDAYAAARHVCFVSEGNQRLVERQFGRSLPNARIIRNPFNVRPDAVVPWPAETGDFRLACVGRLDPHHKGQDLIIEVLGHPRWRDRPLSVTFVGRGGGEQGLRRLASWRMASVRFQGFTDNIEAVWAEHHGLILPSRVEGLPLALVEALWCNRMAVVTDVAGNAEVVTDGVTGFVAPAPTIDLLDATLQRAWERRSAWQTMGTEAGRRVRQLVPADPASVFADFLEATGKNPGGWAS